MTHLCTALLPGAWSRSRLVPLVAVGTVLPDAAGRAIPLGLERLALAGAPIPASWLWPWTALHEPIGWAALGACLGAAFVGRDQARATAALWAGCVLHTALDVLQAHHGEGYLLLAPLSSARFELGWIGSEATVPIALPLAAVTLAAWVPVAVEAAFGPVRLRPRMLAGLAAAMAAAWAVGASPWWSAGALVVAAASWRSWVRREDLAEAAGMAIVLCGLAALHLALALD